MLTVTSDRGDVTLLSVLGRVDYTTAPLLEAELERQFARGRTRIVVDLGEAEYMSSSGASVLLYWLQQARRDHGDVRLACLRPRVRLMIRFAAFDRVFGIYDDLERAVASFD